MTVLVQEYENNATADAKVPLDGVGSWYLSFNHVSHFLAEYMTEELGSFQR